MKGLFATKLRIVLFCVVAALLLYSALGFWVIPAVLKDQIPKITNEKLNRVAQVEQIEFNPFSMELTLSNFDLKNIDHSAFFSFKRLYANIGVLASIKGLTLTLDEISLDEPSTSIKRNKQGDFNFTDLLSGEDTPKEEPENNDDPFPLTIVKTVISKGTLIWEDDFYIHPQKETIYPIDLDLSQFTTKVNEQSEMEIDLALISGGQLNWTGNLEVKPFSSAGKIKIDKLDFKKIWQLFLQDSVNFEILKGTEAIEIDYQLTETEQGLQFLIDNALVHLIDLKLAEKGKNTPVIDIPTFKLSGIEFNLLDRQVTIDNVSADTAKFKAWLNSDGVMNYQTLFSSNSSPSHQSTPVNATASTPQEQPWSVVLNQLALSDFSFNFVDNSLTTPAIFNLASLGITTEAINIDIEDKEDGFQLLIKNAQLNLSDFTLVEKDQTEPLVNIPSFKVSGIAVNLLDKKVAINEVLSTNAKLKAWLNEEGIVNYQSMFSPEVASSDDQATQKSESEAEIQPETKMVATKPEDPAWSITLAKLGLSEFSFHFTDNSLKTPAVFDLTSLNVDVSEYSNQPSTELPFNLGVTINKEGRLKIAGKTVLDPFSSDLKVDAKNVVLKDFQPYIDSFAHLDLISGLFTIDANITLAQPEGQPFDFGLTGNSHITDLITRDSVRNQDFLKWKQLSVKGIDLSLAKNTYNIKSVKLEKPYTRVSIKKDKSLNVTDILIDNGEKEKPEAKENQADNAKPPKFKIEQFTIVDGISDFSDQSLILPFSAHINKLKGTVKGISSHKKAVIKVALNGRVANLAPVTIKGNISPHQGDSKIALDFKGMPLPLMTPYMAEFAGRKIEKGNMSFNLKYDIKNSELIASNDLLIDQLVLGDSVDNPEAVSLPLDLAIALLEDSDGKIKLNMPITGSLDDPQFSVTGLIFDTLFNVLTKIISSPFNAVASLVDSDDDISKVIFLSGQSELDEKQKTKLDGLAKALADRPALKLEIKGTAFSIEDWPALQNEALNNQLLAIRAKVLSEEEGKTILPSHLKPSQEDDDEALADLFIQQHPELADRSLLGTPRLIAPDQPEQDDFYTVARGMLSAKIKPNQQRLEKLATARAQAIAQYLSDKSIAIERVYLLNVVVDPKDSDNLIASSLNLTVK